MLGKCPTAESPQIFIIPSLDKQKEETLINTFKTIVKEDLGLKEKLGGENLKNLAEFINKINSVFIVLWTRFLTTYSMNAS